MTDNNNYGTPAIGSTSGWGGVLNNNFEKLDVDVEIRDTDANKSNYTPKDGAMYRATDTGAIYLGDGTSWVLADIEFDTASGNDVRATTGGIQRQSGDDVWAAEFDGTDRDARLANALNNVQNGDTLHLENGEYNNSYTIGKDLLILGGGGLFGNNGSLFNADVTFNARVRIDNVFIQGAVLKLTVPYSKVTNCLFFGTGVECVVDDSNCVVNAINGGQVTFTSNSSNSIVDSSGGVSVTDNGSNTIGDIA